MFWHFEEYSLYPVIYGSGFLSTYGIFFLLLMRWYDWTGTLEAQSSSQLVERMLVPLIKNETETLGFFFLNWRWKDLVHVM